ncbi:MAG: sigma-54-dependent Fis family transcriptional regulator [Deltaproteobacteria bacterium]|nr:sigma-54-dependent Fis family transcriptional regulator [Deltaproteobacteria bacterium]
MLQETAKIVRQVSIMKKTVVLVVDDEPAIRATLDILLRGTYDVVQAKDGAGALDIVRKKTIDLVLMDVNLPGVDGLAALEAIRDIDAEIGVVMLSGLDSAQQAVAALRKGAFDYVTKPFDNDDLLMTLSRCIQRQRLKNEVAFLKDELEGRCARGEMVSRSPRMREIFDLIRKVGSSSSNVLITGESGTGKELVARAIQAAGERRNKPFVAVNCGAVPSELMESELFGHEKGAFTGAHARKLGRFEYADGGTIFFDEVSTLPMGLQVKLLRALQEKTFERVGSNVSIKVDIRFIAATNTDLEAAVRAGTFRDDLYYRLNVVPIKLPPLRERKEDVAPLVEHFIAKHARLCNKRINGITGEALAALGDYHWPGNIRELENLIERLVVLGRDGHEIGCEDLPVGMLLRESAEPSGGEIADFREACRTFEKRYIIEVLNKTNWNRIRAADFMKVHRNTLFMKMKGLGIKPPVRGDA